MTGVTVPEASGQTATDRVRAELGALRAGVAGTRGGLVATSDGLLVAHDLAGMEPGRMAALVATTVALAGQAAAMTGCGQLAETITRGSTGYLAVFAIGRRAALAVLGGEDLDAPALRERAAQVVDRLRAYAGEFTRFGEDPGARPDPRRDHAQLGIALPRR